MAEEGEGEVKRAIVEVTRTYIVEYDRLSALDDYLAQDEPGEGFGYGDEGHYDSRRDPDVKTSKRVVKKAKR